MMKFYGDLTVAERWVGLALVLMVAVLVAAACHDHAKVERCHESGGEWVCRTPAQAGITSDGKAVFIPASGCMCTPRAKPIAQAAAIGHDRPRR